MHSPIFCFAFVFFTLASVFGQPLYLPVSLDKNEADPCIQQSWELVFEDNFKAKLIDGDKWFSYYPYGENYSDDCEFCRAPSPAAQIYEDDNLVLEDGMLKIRVKKENSTWFSQKRPYTSGIVYSKNSFQYGKFEIRCKIPDGRGFIPAFWLWSGAGEIDIFEFGCHKPNKHNMTIHIDHKGSHYFENTKQKGADYSQDFHVFTLEWEPRQILWKVDGKIVRAMARYETLDGKPLYCPQALPKGKYRQNLYFPQGKLRVIANVTVATPENAFTRPPRKKTVFPADFEIDYIRVYQRK